MITTEEQIDRLVKKYQGVESKELFRAELEHLVLLAEREQLIKDTIDVRKIMKGKK